MLEVVLPGWDIIATGEDGQVFDFHHIINFMRDCSSGAIANATRALPGVQRCGVRGGLVYYGLDDTGYCSGVQRSSPGQRWTLVSSGAPLS